LIHYAAVAYTGRHYGGRNNGAMWSMEHSDKQAAKGSKPSSVFSSSSRTQQMSLSGLPRMMNQQQRPPQLSSSLSEATKGRRLSQLQAVSLMNDPFGINAIIHPNLQQALVLGFAAFCFAQTKNAYDEKRQVEENRRRARSNNLLPESTQPVMSPRVSRIQDQLLLLERAKRWKEEANSAKKQHEEETPLKPWPDSSTMTAPAVSSTTTTTFVPPVTPPSYASQPPAPVPDPYKESGFRFGENSSLSYQNSFPPSGMGATGAASSSSSSTSASTAAATMTMAPPMPAVSTAYEASRESYVSGGGGETMESGSSYLSNVASTQTFPSSYSTQPAPAPAVVESTTTWSYATSTETTGSKKSYSMSKWSPGSSTGSTAGTTGSSSASYLENMGSTSGAVSVAPSYASTPVMAPPAPAETTPLYTAAATTTIDSSSKKSYSMSKWSPGSSTGGTGTTGSSNSYLENMANSAVTLTPAYTIPSTPAPAPPPPPAPLFVAPTTTLPPRPLRAGSAPGRGSH